MPQTDLLIPFLVASALFAVTPGPGMFYAAARTLAAGRAAGWWSALGFHIAGLGHVAAGAFGVTALLAVMPSLFAAMKLAGAACLILLGLRYLLGAAPTAAAAAAGPAGRPRSALGQSIAVEALNPKSALFHFAFLPQFADPAAALPLWAQILLLGAIANAMFSLADALPIELAHALAVRLGRSVRLVAWLRRIAGGVLVGLGIKLALARQA